MSSIYVVNRDNVHFSVFESQGQNIPKMAKWRKKKNKQLAISWMLFKGTFNDPSADDLDLQSRSKVKVKISQKWVKY